MKQFNLEEFKKNPLRKVVTRDGKPVRILCTDANGDYPVVGLIYYHDKRDVPENYTKNGSCYIDDESSCDLFFAPIKKEGWINVFKATNTKTDTYTETVIYNTKEEALQFVAKINLQTHHDIYLDTIHIEWEE